MAESPSYVVACASPQNPSVNLVCIPSAGAGIGPFLKWRPVLAENVALYGVRLPGRESRLLDKPLTDLASVAEAVGREVLSLGALPVVLFGHCSGALVALEVARELEALVPGDELHAKLIVASQHAPHAFAESEARSLIAEDARELIPAELLADSDLAALIVRTIDADTEMIVSHRYSPDRLQMPLDVLFGKSDPFIAARDAEAWRSLAGEYFATRRLNGDHTLSGAAWVELGACVSALCSLREDVAVRRLGGENNPKRHNGPSP